MLRAHEMEVMIPDSHRLVIEVPKTVRSGRARLILLEGSREEGDEEATPPQADDSWAALGAMVTGKPLWVLSYGELAQEISDALAALGPPGQEANRERR